jgi:hypothetical protein
MRVFEEELVQIGQWPLRAIGIETLQVNLGSFAIKLAVIATWMPAPRARR